VHRQFPEHYLGCVKAAGVRRTHPVSTLAYCFNCSKQDRAAWKAQAGSHPQWPPPAPGSQYDVAKTVAAAKPHFAAHVAALMPHFATLLRTWLRPHFETTAVLAKARTR
jgi:hypothetical protein